MSKKSERLYEILQEMDDDMIVESAPINKKTPKPTPLKWISAAACFVLVAGIGVGVWRSGITDPSSAVSKADDIPKVSDNTTELPENTDTSDTPAITDTQHESNSGEDAIGGGDTECPIHGIGTYTGIPGEIIDYVGMETFLAWSEPQYSNNTQIRNDNCSCIVTFPDFIEHFDIPDEVIIDYYYNKGGYYSFDWDLDIILSRDWEAFDEYAQIHQGFDEEMMKRETERRFKIELLDSIENSTNEESKTYWYELTNNGTNYNVAKWSIAEFVDKTDIDILSLNSILTSVSVNPSTGEERPMFEYDFSSLFAPADGEMSVMSSGSSVSDAEEDLYPVQQDALLHK